jgi:hypothetical protein
MIIRFLLGSRRSDSQAGRRGGSGKEVRLETHPSGLNRTDARRLSQREIAHRERMLEHLHRTLSDASSPFPVR